MKKKEKISTKSKDYKIYLVFVRYLILLLLVFMLPIFYKILTFLTLYSSRFLLKLVYANVDIINNLIIINFNTLIELIPACVAGSAYALLLILNLSVPMNFKKRIFSIILSFVILFALNTLRIFVLAVLYSNKSPFFDLTHKIFWYFLSTIFVVFVWFLTVKIFLIKNIPVYTDIKTLIRNIKAEK